jgi:hypothetical protein
MDRTGERNDYLRDLLNVGVVSIIFSKFGTEMEIVSSVQPELEKT